MQNTGVRIWPTKYGNWALSVLSHKVLLPEQSLPVLVANQSRFVAFYALKPSNTSLITKHSIFSLPHVVSLFLIPTAPRIGLYTASLVSLTDVLIGWCASDCDAPTHIVTYPNKHGEYPPSPTWRASPTWRKQKAFPLPVEKAGNSLLFQRPRTVLCSPTWDVKQSNM